MEFVAVDVETANPDMASVCQIGVAVFTGREVADEWESLVDPRDWFSPFNVCVHGITEDMVIGAPTIPDIAPEIRDRMQGRVVVCHTPFDRISIHQAFAAHDLEVPSSTWLDSARVARRAWPEVCRSGYGLANVCSLIGYQFAHHDALEDAKAAGQVLLAASAETGLGLDEWLVRVEQPINPASVTPIAREGNPDGPLFGEVMVFTGALSVPRREAADLAAAIGCRVDSGVTKRTTTLVVGDQDVTKLGGHNRSSKHRKAEELISAGQGIRILRESDFMVLVGLESQPAGS